jgi:hypothetical protein
MWETWGMRPPPQVSLKGGLLGIPPNSFLPNKAYKTKNKLKKKEKIKKLKNKYIKKNN